MEEIITKDNLNTYTLGLKSVLSSIGLAIESAGSDGDDEYRTYAKFGDWLYSDLTTSSGYNYSDSSKTVIGRCVIPALAMDDRKARFISLQPLLDKNNNSTMVGGSVYDVLRSYSCIYSVPGAYASNSDVRGGVCPYTDQVSTGIDKDYSFMCGSYGSTIYEYPVEEHDEENDSYYTKTELSDCLYPTLYHLGDSTSYPEAIVGIFGNWGLFHTPTIKYTDNALYDTKGYETQKRVINYLKTIHPEINFSSSTLDKFVSPYIKCYNYSTAGTNNGDWYLPTIGELVCAADNMNNFCSNSDPKDMLNHPLFGFVLQNDYKYHCILSSTLGMYSNWCLYNNLDDVYVRDIYDISMPSEGYTIFPFIAL